MRLTKTRIIVVFLSCFLFISIVYFASIIKLFLDTRNVDASPEASIEHYLSSNTNEYKVINITLSEKKFRDRIYVLECECNFKNGKNSGIQTYKVHLIEDIGWIVTKIEGVFL
ncbi:hypothetical protein [Paenibacillus qinlingensis]|uniref:Secreted protein with C-terminal beta-propeller domain n=1 Tax=Paenibacillus qinlingensis TaxID=1837343 RepID=A0ABU1NUK6_9BACL|nr:hypothetical protein [Paenibacillus qinlingensis]MDR6550761.1 putative secreted protein with C-terminal beta-propeller domain [Paenibacillus qinlingensis]